MSTNAVAMLDATASLHTADEPTTELMDTSTASASLTTQPQFSTHKQQAAEEAESGSELEPGAPPSVRAPQADSSQSVTISNEATATASSPSSSSASASSLAPSTVSSPTSASPAASPASLAPPTAATLASPLLTPDPTSTSPLSPPPSPQTAHPPAANHHSDSEDTTVESYTPTTTQPTRITVQLPRKTHADVVFYHLPTHRDALHHLSILRHIINASEHTDDNTAITYAQYAANPHTKKFYQSNLPLPSTLDPLPFTVRCLVRCLNRVSQQKKVVDVEHVLPSERSAHVYSTLRLQVIQLYGSHPPIYPFAPTSIAPSPPPAATAAATTVAANPTSAVIAPDASTSSSAGSTVPATAAAPGPPLPIPPEKQRPTDVVFFYLASYNDVMYHNSILSNVLHTIGQKDDKAYIPYSLYLASPRTTEHYPTGPPLPPSCDPIPFTLRGVLSCLARVRRQRRAQKTQLTSVEPLERNGVVYARIREQVFRLYDGQPPSMAGLEGPKRSSSGGSGSTRRNKGLKRADDEDGDDRMDEDNDHDSKAGSSGLATPGLARNLSASSDDSVPGSPGSSPPSSASSEPDMLDHLLNASAAVNGSEVKLLRVKQRREAEKERRRKRMREDGDARGKAAKEMKVKVDGDKGEKGEKSEKENGKEKEKAESDKEAAGKSVNGSSEKVEQEQRERAARAERLYSKLSELGSALPDRDTFLKLWEACH